MKVLPLLVFTFTMLLGCVENTTGSSLSSLTKNPKDSLAAPVAVSVSLSTYQFPYQLRKPSQSFKLAHILEEISGLCMTSDNRFLYSVQDEKGKIYKIDVTSGKIIERFNFGKKGDYEGLAYHQNKFFITKSNGTISEVENLGEDIQKVTNYNTDLKGKNDIEGLCYQPSTNSLLIACKGIPTFGETSEESAHRKSVYRFDLETKKLQEKPFYRITLKKVQQFLKKSASQNDFKKFLSYLDEDDHFNFSPSGIAIHPKTEDVYILSSSKKMLLIINQAGEIQHMVKLSKKIHRQPEGITFAEDGTLYISNEGKGGHARIFVYKPQI